MDTTNVLKKIYYDPKSPAGFSSVQKLYDVAKLELPKLTLSEVRRFLRGQITYTLHKQAKRKFKRNPVIVAHPGEQWQGDLMDMTQWSKFNGGHNYILTLIDIFSKKGYAIPIKRKQGEHVAKALEGIFKHEKPTYLQTDKGTEFKNKQVQQVLKDYEVAYFTSHNEAIKCSIVERFNSTLKNKIFRIATKRGTRNWTNILDSVVEAYNKTKHRSIKMAPNDVNDSNVSQVFKNLYGFMSYREYLLAKANDREVLPVGAKVRKAYDKGRFDRGYFPYFTDTIHEVKSVTSKAPRHTYKLDDEPRDYYAEEIQQVDDSPLYRIKKVIKERMVNGIKQKLVEFIGYHGTEWVNASDIEAV